MIKIAPIALLATVATLAVVPTAVFAAENIQQVREANGAAAGVSVAAGNMLYGPDGKRLAPVYRVTSSGDVQIILASKLVTVPAASLSEADGKVATSLTKKELNRR